MDKEAADQFLADLAPWVAEISKHVDGPYTLHMPERQYEMLRRHRETELDRAFARGEWWAAVERVSRVAAAEMFAFSRRAHP